MTSSTSTALSLEKERVIASESLLSVVDKSGH